MAWYSRDHETVQLCSSSLTYQFLNKSHAYFSCQRLGMDLCSTDSIASVTTSRAPVEETATALQRLEERVAWTTYVGECQVLGEIGGKHV